MKKIIATALIIASLLVGTKHKQYALVGRITNVDRDKDVISFVDIYGASWEMSGCEDYEVDDNIACVMDDNGTEDFREDDIIINARYIG